MEKTDLIVRVADRTGLSKRAAAAAVNVTFQEIIEALYRGEKIRLIGFGVFEVRQSAGRTGRDPRTKKIIQIPPRKVPVFRMSPIVKQAIK